MSKNMRLGTQITINVLLLVTILFWHCGCDRHSKEDVDAKTHPNVGTKTPPDVVELLLQAIELKDWKTSCEYLSSDFLKDNKEKVMEGTYFRRSRKKDRTSFYTSQARVSSEWKLENDGTIAIVTLNIGAEKPGALMGICQVKLIEESGCWKVSDF